jgi:hypothetical protein
MSPVIYRCVAEKSNLPGIAYGRLYGLVCVGLNITTLQELVTYQGLDGPDEGRCFHTTLSHWAAAFEAMAGGYNG